MRWKLLAAAMLFTAAASGAGVKDPAQAAGEVERREGFRWGPALRQSFLFLSIEHSLRLTQAKTREQFQGKFFRNYWSCIKSIRGWGDGDSFFTNYIAHPMQGAVAGFIQIHNDPAGITQEFSREGAYWRSRFKSMAWSAAYSTQFEIGPISEATIGHVGKRPGTAGLTDLVMTPTGGLGMTVLEDALDRLLIRKFEAGSGSLGWQRFMRVSLNPQRTFANLLRFKRPWHRDTRDLNRWRMPMVPAGVQVVSAADAAARERAKEVLRLGTVRVRTPRGTDFMFRVGSRPFHVEDVEGGDGLLRVAPPEQASFGQISLPELRLGGAVGKNAVIEVDNGRITRIRAAEGAEELAVALAAMGEAAHRFAEFSIGFSSSATDGPSARGMVCLGFGGNEELGGALKGPLLHRHCLADATVHVDFRYLVRDGKLTE